MLPPSHAAARPAFAKLLRHAADGARGLTMPSEQPAWYTRRRLFKKDDLSSGINTTTTLLLMAMLVAMTVAMAEAMLVAKGTPWKMS